MRQRSRVLDATAFFLDIPLEGELLTTPGVVGEVVDLESKCRLEVLLAAGLAVRTPAAASLKSVEVAAVETGDDPVLSAADREVLALALETGSEIVTDDFAVQNVAAHLGIPVVPIQQRRARKRKWKFRCPACGKAADGPGDCPVCGSLLKRTLK
ncbi:MAG: nucleotide-binding protein [Methanolinea sp.]|nr:nucleotide-binding protein [Methanolinea sp.]